ncbi:DEAD/DEAH box helicase [Parafrankia sp. FMc2]|uniref:DEAD/DEAH box helicase n=1 Tax=Parafrankia sp. FMc2 TaxID=3233196 RepID=UPI0034D52316
MKVAEVSHGRESEVELEPVDRPDLHHLDKLAEVGIRQSRPDEPWLTYQSRPEAVRGRRPKDRALLDNLFGRHQAVLSWIAAVSNDGKCATVHLHAFEQAQRWDAQNRVDIAVDDKIHDDVARRVIGSAHKASVDPLPWLREEFLLPSGPSDGMPRLIVSGSADNGLSLHGRRFTLDVRRREEGTLFAERLTHQRPNTRHGSLTLLTAPVHFTDARRATRLDAEVAARLAHIGAQSRSYLDLWQQYNELEHEYILTRARELGAVWYASRSVNADGSWRFQLEKNNEAREFLRKARIQRDDHGLELVADANPPTFGLDDSAVPRPTNARGPRRHGATLTGNPKEINAEELTVDLAPPRSRDQERHPPTQGYLYRAYRGDEAQIERRRRVRDRIANGQAEMEGLHLLLQGIVPSPRGGRRRHAEMSTAAKALFGGPEPTENQRTALGFALNTPDIVLIQGPPGTGKTQLIAALQQRLVEIGESVETVQDSLLTSFQHYAVDNVVRKILVRGLPPSRIDSRDKDQPAEVAERWRRERVATLRATMAPESRAWTRVRELEDLVVGYITAPPTVTATVGVLSEVERLSAELVPLPLRERVIRLRDGLRARADAHLARDVNVTPTQRLVRGLRCTVNGHADDGPARAVALLNGFPDWLALPAASRSDLTEASAGAVDDALLGRLRVLRDDLLDQLVADTGPAAAPAVDPDVRELLEDVVATAMTAVRESANGIDVAVSEYLDELVNDPYLVERSLIEYSTVRASTCQQADSSLMRAVMRDSLVFDTVIVDEAARVSPLDMMIPMSLARRRIVLVGDHAQLPHILQSKLEEQLDQRAPDSGQSAVDWQTVLRTSLFQRLYVMFQKAGADDRVIRLDKQFRMHPELGNLVSRNFYESAGPPIENGVTSADRRHGLAGYGERAAAWLDVGAEYGEARRVGKSWTRKEEAARIAREIKKLAHQAPNLTFGVISFYSEQVHLIKEQLALLDLATETNGEFIPVPDLARTPDGAERLRVGSVDAFQGSEFDVVLLSMVRSTGTDQPARLDRRHYGHLTIPNRQCVALSRAKRLLIGVGDAAMFDRHVAPPEVAALTDFLEMCRAGNMVRP